MSVVSENAIVISATIDTSGVTNGVERIKQSAEQIRAEFEKSAAESSLNYAKSGEKAADGFLSGMAGRILGSMLIRDAIRGALMAGQEAISDFMADMNSQFGLPAGKGFHPINMIGEALGGAGQMAANFLPFIRRAGEEAGQAGLRSANASALTESEAARFKEDPSSLAKTSVLQDQLSATVSQLAATKHQKASLIDLFQEAGIPFDSNSDEVTELDSKIKGLSEKERGQRELVALGKERDRKDDESSKKAAADKERLAHKGAEDFMKDQEFMFRQAEKTAKEKEEADAKAAREAKEAARDAKDAKKKSLDSEISDLGKSQGPIDKDLDFTEKQLAHQRATSAVSIQGGLYGRNDSAAVLVQHAAQQVNLLRSIDANIKDIRAQREELTLA